MSHKNGIDIDYSWAAAVKVVVTVKVVVEV